MATKSKTTTKPRTAKKTVKGSGGIKKNNTNWTFIIVLLVLVTAVGGYFAYRSQIKAAGNSWTPNESPPWTVNGGGAPKVDGSNRWVTSTPGDTLTFQAYFNASNSGAPKNYCVNGDIVPVPNTPGVTYYSNGGAVGATAGYYPNGFKAVRTVTDNTGGSDHIWRYCWRIEGQPIPPAGKQAWFIWTIKHNGGTGSLRVQKFTRS